MHFHQVLDNRAGKESYENTGTVGSGSKDAQEEDSSQASSEEAEEFHRLIKKGADFDRCQEESHTGSEESEQSGEDAAQDEVSVFGYGRTQTAVEVGDDNGGGAVNGAVETGHGGGKDRRDKETGDNHRHFIDDKGWKDLVGRSHGHVHPVRESVVVSVDRGSHRDEEPACQDANNPGQPDAAGGLFFVPR